MPIPKATQVKASERTANILHTIVRRRTAPLWLVTRVQIVIQAVDGHSNSAISQDLKVDRGAVRSGCFYGAVSLPLLLPPPIVQFQSKIAGVVSRFRPAMGGILVGSVLPRIAESCDRGWGLIG